MSTKMYGVVMRFVKIRDNNSLLRDTQELLSVTATFITQFG